MLRDKTVLIVDDEPAIRDMLRMVLEKAGYRCFEATNGQQARAIILNEQPSLVLLDWMLPGYQWHCAIAPIEERRTGQPRFPLLC